MKVKFDIFLKNNSAFFTLISLIKSNIFSLKIKLTIKTIVYYRKKGSILIND